MNFDDTPQEAAFRSEARQWIAANAPKQYEAELSKSSIGRIKLQKEEIVDVGKAWQKKKAEGGWACLHWPKEYGGRGATPIEKVIWQQEEGVYGKLTQPFQIGEGMCGPTVMAFGSEERQAPLSAEARFRRTDLVPAVFGARRRSPTLPACAPAPRRKATTGSSTARRSGPPARTTPTTAS